MKILVITDEKNSINKAYLSNRYSSLSNVLEYNFSEIDIVDINKLYKLNKLSKKTISAVIINSIFDYRSYIIIQYCNYIGIPTGIDICSFQFTNTSFCSDYKYWINSILNSICFLLCSSEQSIKEIQEIFSKQNIFIIQENKLIKDKINKSNIKFMEKLNFALDKRIIIITSTLDYDEVSKVSSLYHLYNHINKLKILETFNFSIKLNLILTNRYLSAINLSLFKNLPFDHSIHSQSTSSLKKLLDKSFIYFISHEPLMFKYNKHLNDIYSAVDSGCQVLISSKQDNSELTQFIYDSSSLLISDIKSKKLKLNNSITNNMPITNNSKLINKSFEKLIRNTDNNDSTFINLPHILINGLDTEFKSYPTIDRFYLIVNSFHPYNKEYDDFGFESINNDLYIMISNKFLDCLHLQNTDLHKILIKNSNKQKIGIRINFNISIQLIKFNLSPQYEYFLTSLFFKQSIMPKIIYYNQHIKFINFIINSFFNKPKIYINESTSLLNMIRT